MLETLYDAAFYADPDLENQFGKILQHFNARITKSNLEQDQ